MFTGIVEEIGKIQKITNSAIEVECANVLEGTKIGDSISVNGVCLTVADLYSGGFSADVSSETFRVSALNNLKSGNFVNLERAMKADGRFGGHIVSGHVDGVGKVVGIKKLNEFYEFEFELNTSELRYVIKKGSIAINGISLTIAEVFNKSIKLAIIPHTFEHTSLKYLSAGNFVNIEVDMMAKYIEKFLSTSDNKSNIDIDFLQENGFL